MTRIAGILHQDRYACMYIYGNMALSQSLL